MKIDEIQIYNDVYSPLKVAYHLKDIEKIRNGELIVPKFLMLHPEAFCSNACSFCAYRYSGWDKQGMKFLGEWAGENPVLDRSRPVGKLVPEKSGLPKDIALSLPPQMNELGIPAVEITGSGEPTLYPYIQDLFKGFMKYNIETALVTNGQNLRSELDLELLGNLQWLRVSMDSCTPETHSIVHGVSKRMFEVAYKNIIKARELYSNSIIGISYIITRDNTHEIEKATQFWKDTGVNSIRFSFEYEPTGTANLQKYKILESYRAINRAKQLQSKEFKVFGQTERIDTFARPNDDFTFCGYQMFTWNIGYNAKIYPCCIELYQNGMDFGDLRKESLEQIAFSESHKKYIENFDVTACHNCWLREKNISIETLLKPERRLGHVNFV